jgi:hypothetical protein
MGVRAQTSFGICGFYLRFFRTIPGWSRVVTAFLLVLSANAAVSVRTQLDRDTIMAGETATLTISVEGGTPRSIESFPSNTGLTIQYRGTTQSTTIINGAASFKHLLNFIVQAAQPGQYTIPSVKVVADGQSYATEAVRLTVTKSDTAGGSRYAFLKLIVPKQEIYVGEMLPIEVQLYVTDAENVQNPQIKSDGFVIHKTLEPTRAQSQVGNMMYTVLSYRMLVSAAKAGKLSLGPAEMNLVLRLRSQPDPNDLFGFFGRYQRRAVTLNSPAAEVNVLTLPSGAPADFSGAIGNFRWSVTANPTNVAAGDPITMKVVVNGRGNFDNLKLPEVNWPDFKVYTPNVSTTPEDPLGISGVKTFEQVIVPQSATTREIPALTLTYFDPDQKRYVQLAQAATALSVRPSSGGPAVPTVVAAQNGNSADDESPDRTDIVHIKSDPGPIAAIAPPLVRQPWFLIVQGLPLLGFVAASFWRKRQDQLANNPRLRRKIEVGQVVSNSIPRLRELAGSNQSDEFFALVFRLLQEQLGERLDLPASAITEAVLDERLPRRNASADLIARLHALFQVCNQARYAPVQTNEEFQAVASNLEKALGELQQLPD